MNTQEAVKRYEAGKNRKFRAFSGNSLIDLWPHLHRSPIVWTALTLNTIAAFASVYATSQLDRTSNSSDIAILILLVTSITGFMAYMSSTLASWICVLEENTVRSMLVGSESKNASLANNDLPIAIATVAFYISAPAQIVSIMVYAGYVIFRSPIAMVCLVLCVLLFLYPIYRFSIWRRKMIRVVRHYRNNLVDEHGDSGASTYSSIVDSYAHSVIEYFWRDTQALYILRLVVFLFLFAILKYGVPDEHGFSVLIALLVLIGSGHAFFNSLLKFQEDKVSLGRVKDVLSTCRTDS